jgi:hypothetical protein
VIQASSSGRARHAQTPSSPVRTGTAGLSPLEPGPFEADHQLSDRLKRGPQQFWYSGRLARAGANSRLRGGITGWPVATVGLCAWMTPLGWRAWRSGCCAPILAASSSRSAAVGRITLLLMVLTDTDRCCLGAVGPDQPGPQRAQERGVQHPHPYLAVGRHVHQRQPLQQGRTGLPFIGYQRKLVVLYLPAIGADSLDQLLVGRPGTGRRARLASRGASIGTRPHGPCMICR